MASDRVENMFIVLNPSGEQKIAAPLPLTPRSKDFSGKTIYCISQHVGNADRFLNKVVDNLPTMMNGVSAVFRKKTSAYMSDDPELWDEVKKKGAAFIYGCGA
jgi:hypothetical protein